jgi:hypothetical protein
MGPVLSFRHWRSACDICLPIVEHSALPIPSHVVVLEGMCRVLECPNACHELVSARKSSVCRAAMRGFSHLMRRAGALCPFQKNCIPAAQSSQGCGDTKSPRMGIEPLSKVGGPNNMLGDGGLLKTQCMELTGDGVPIRTSLFASRASTIWSHIVSQEVTSVQRLAIIFTVKEASPLRTHRHGASFVEDRSIGGDAPDGEGDAVVASAITDHVHHPTRPEVSLPYSMS